MAWSSIPKRLEDTTPAAASTAVSAKIAAGLGGFDQIAIYADLVGATGGTLDVYLQSSYDDGVTWYDLVHFPQLAAGASAIRYKVCPIQTNTITVIGKGTSGTPAVALAANACSGAHWGDSIRAVYVAGASTSAGAAVKIHIFGSNARR